ncbi:MAG: hypothetical protein IJL07_04655 [Lachnospiraceae bacterium]|nr:hypothetical protein [Lachnospiraceae bacterium]
MRKKAFYLNYLTVVLGVIGTGIMIGKYCDNGFTLEGLKNLKYFTNVSNIFATVVAVISIVRKRQGKPQMMRLKLFAAAALGLTFLTVICYLAPFVAGFPRAYRNESFIFHLLLPLTAIAEYIFSESDGAKRISAKGALITVLGPAVYGTVYVIQYLSRGMVREADWYSFIVWGLPIGMCIFLVLMLITWGLSILLCKLRRD